MQDKLLLFPFAASGYPHFSSNNAFLTDYLSFVSVTKSPKSGKIKIQNIPHRKEVLNMRKKIWKILPLVTGLVLLTASSALTVHGESDNTIDVTLFKLNLPDDWSYDPNDISDYEIPALSAYSKVQTRIAHKMISPLKQMKNQATLSANICRPPISIFMTMQTALLKKQPLAMWIIYEPQTILTEFTTFIVTSIRCDLQSYHFRRRK